MWVLLIVYTLGGEPQVEQIVVRDADDCFSTMTGVKDTALRAQKPIELRCVEIPDETYEE
jgi:hypothetical protein